MTNLKKRPCLSASRPTPPLVVATWCRNPKEGHHLLIRWALTGQAWKRHYLNCLHIVALLATLPSVTCFATEAPPTVNSSTAGVITTLSEQFLVPLTNASVMVRRWGSGPKGVIFFNHSGPMAEEMTQKISSYMPLLEKDYSFFVWNYPTNSPFDQIQPYIGEWHSGATIDSHKPNFTCIATTIVEGIEKQTHLSSYLVVGNSLGAGVILWDYKTLKTKPELKFLLISPTEAFCPSPETLEDLTNTVMISNGFIACGPEHGDPWVREARLIEWIKKNLTPYAGIDKDARMHWVIGESLEHEKLKELIRLAATPQAASNQRSEKTTTLPDGMKVIILQEYAQSYMVTKEGEHKPFFIDKTVSSPAPPLSKPTGTPMYWGKSMDYDFIDPWTALTPEENNKYVNIRMTLFTNSITKGDIEKFRAAESYAGLSLLEKQKLNVLSENFFNEEAIKIDPSLKTIAEKIKNFKPWENPLNPISALTPEEGQRFVEIAQAAHLDKKADDACRIAMKDCFNLSPAEQEKRAAEYYGKLEDAMLKLDPNIGALIKKVKNFSLSSNIPAAPPKS